MNTRRRSLYVISFQTFNFCVDKPTQNGKNTKTGAIIADNFNSTLGIVGHERKGEMPHGDARWAKLHLPGKYREYADL